MTVNVKPLTHPEVIREAALNTVWETTDKPIPAQVSYFRKYFISEHSPIRSFIIRVKWVDISRRSMGHLVRHVHSLPFVASTRPDRFPEHAQDETTTMILDCNVQSVIDIARKRLCTMAFVETIQAVRMLKRELMAYNHNDPVVEAAMRALGQVMVPNCVYRGACPEGNRGCTLYEQLIAEVGNIDNIAARYEEYNKRFLDIR